MPPQRDLPRLQDSTISRRQLCGWGAAAGAIVASRNRAVSAEQPRSTELSAAISELESFFTLPEDFRDVSRGQPLPHRLPDETKEAVGLTRESWQLEILSDPEHPATLERPRLKQSNTAIDFRDLMQLAESKAVRFAKVMTCLNIGCPLGMGIWEGVPLRDLVWMTGPSENLRRVFYHGYHNDKPEQMFRSSLPVGRVLEDPLGLPPVILCYKLNGEWLSSERGGPVRVVVPEAYGFKSIKWLTHIYLSNLAHANDTYAEKNNDIDSPLKTFAATLGIPATVRANQPFAVTGYAQVGTAGLTKVQVGIQPADEPTPEDDPSYEAARCYNQTSWEDAVILPPPDDWRGGLPGGSIPPNTFGFDANSGRPLQWPLKLAKVHWYYHCGGLAAGKYTFRCRTIDENANAQPMPRPFRKSGHAAIEQKTIVVEA